MTSQMDLEELFLRRKPVRLLMAMKIGSDVKYVSILAKETDCTYSHTVKLLEQFENFGLVAFEKQGRVKFIRLTPEGTELANDFESVLRKFGKLKAKKPVEKKPAPKPQPEAKKPK